MFLPLAVIFARRALSFEKEALNGWLQLFASGFGKACRDWQTNTQAGQCDGHIAKGALPATLS